MSSLISRKLNKGQDCFLLYLLKLLPCNIVKLNLPSISSSLPRLTFSPSHPSYTHSTIITEDSQKSADITAVYQSAQPIRRHLIKLEQSIFKTVLIFVGFFVLHGHLVDAQRKAYTRPGFAISIARVISPAHPTCLHSLSS